MIEVPAMEEIQQPVEQPQGPLVSVLILSFNRGAALRRCLEALERSQDRALLQVIVLDPGSYQSASALQVDFPEVTILRMPRNFGATKALNIGFRTVKADMVLFLDPAIVVEPDTIFRLIAALDANTDAAAVCPLLVDAQGQVLPQVRKLPDSDTLWKVWQDETAVPASVPAAGERIVAEYPGRRALLIRLPFLKGMNYFDEHYGDWGADLEMAFQIRHAAKKALIIGDIRVTDHLAAEAAPRWSNGQRATLAADRLNGVARFVARRAGFFGGVQLRLTAALITFVRALTFQSPGYNWSLLTGLLSGTKIDGSQGDI